MIPFKAIYKETEISFSIPQSFEELTLKQLCLLNEWDKKDITKLLSILCNIEHDIIFNSSSLDIEDKIIPLLSWMKEPHDFENLILPKHITIDGKQYQVPKDIMVKTLGQKISLQLFLAKAQVERRRKVDCIPFALAIYFQPEITNTSFSEDRAKELIPIIEQCKMLEAYPTGDFFLSRFIGFLNERAKSYGALRRKSKLRQALRNWSRLGFLERWMPLQKVTY